MPWNIAKEFWPLLRQARCGTTALSIQCRTNRTVCREVQRRARVPLFHSKLVVPVIYINNVPEYLKEGSPFLRYLRETKVPFAILINYGAATIQRSRRRRRLATAQRRIERSVSRLDLGRERRLRLGVCAGGVEDLALDVAARIARSAPAVLHEALARKWRETFQD